MTANADVVLTFDQNPTLSSQLLDQDYGDRVTSSPDSNGHFYDIIPGNGLGLTPNVVVSYEPSANSAPMVSSGYGDLVNAHYNASNTNISLQVILEADPGFEVGLFGFDVASSQFLGQTVQLIQILDGTDDVLWSAGSTGIGSIANGGHTDFDFASGLFASSITIELDLNNLGVFSDDIAIDNIHFSQRSIPEPSSLTALLVISALLVNVNQRRLT